MGRQLHLPFLDPCLDPPFIDPPLIDPGVLASWQHLDAAPLQLTPWERLRDLLEACYLRLRYEHPFGPAFRTAWVRSRRRLCDEHGWTEDAFYTELSARRRKKPTLRIVARRGDVIVDRDLRRRRRATTGARRPGAQGRERARREVG